MDDIPLQALIGALLLLVALSAFFSGAETGMMAINRYRLRHRAAAGHRGARRVERLLRRPDRLIGLILLGNNFANILASAIATLIGLRLFGDAGVAIAAGALTCVILIFSEVAPKTFAALNPERIAFPAAALLAPLLRLLNPLVRALNLLANGFLRLTGAPVARLDGRGDSLTSEELRTVVMEASGLIPKAHQTLLANLLELERVTVEDVMIPRDQIVGIDIEARWTDILDRLSTARHTRLPVFRETLDNLVGVLHLRTLIALPLSGGMDKGRLMERVDEPLFIPRGTALNAQLLRFQKARQRLGLVVDEYGDIQGLVTLEDILEEIVGEFAAPDAARAIRPQPDGSWLVDGAANLRDLNRIMQWELPEEGPKTLNGLVLERLEDIPEPNTGLLIAGCRMEIVQSTESGVRTVRVYPAQRPKAAEKVAEKAATIETADRADAEPTNETAP